MRILIDYRPALRQGTGVGEYVQRLVAALEELSRAATADTRRDPPVLTRFSSSWKDRVPPGPGLVCDRRIPVRLLNLLWHRLEWPPVERLTGDTFDVVHSPHPLLIPTRGAARIVTIHDLDFLRHPERTQAEVRRDYAALVHAHARRADRIIVPSAHTAAQVAACLGVSPDDITVCRHGAPPWRPRDTVPEDGPILFVGTLEPRKNVGRLLEAYRILLAHGHEPPRLLLAGRATPSAAPWLDAITRAPLAGRVHYLGYVTDTVRETLYRQARVLVLPSLDEGFGLPVLEAMTMGVPVVASRGGALPEVLGDAGLLIDPERPDELAAGIARMISDTALARRAVALGRARAGLYTWMAAARTTLDAYELAIAHRRGHQGGHAS